MKNIYNNKLKKFWTISLKELNNKASYLKRIDTKYLLTWEQLSKILDKLKENYKVLEIKWQKLFSYDNVYMDTSDYLFYEQHQSKKEFRTKVRTRYYTDSNLAFFEYKQKQDWITNKYRYEFPSEEHWFMTKGKKRFFEWVWQSMYSKTKAPKISPSIKTKYKRITLVSKNSKERLTIDFDIKTLDLRNPNASEMNLKNLVIIESKSLKKNCYSSKLMKKNHIKKAKSCSKYSLWIVYSGIAKKYDTFKETMETIKEIRLETLKNRNRVSTLLQSTDRLVKKDEILKVW